MHNMWLVHASNTWMCFVLMVHRLEDVKVIPDVCGICQEQQKHREEAKVA